MFIGDPVNKEIVEDPANGGQQITLYQPQNGFVPGGIAVDLAGDVFVADTGNQQVLEIPAGGGAAIPVGSGWVSPQAVALDAAGDVYVSDLGLIYQGASGEIVEVPVGCPGGSCQTAVVTGNPAEGVALDAQGDVFFRGYERLSRRSRSAGYVSDFSRFSR